VRGATSLLIVLACCGWLLPSVRAQNDALPTARLVAAPRLVMPGAVDSNIPMAWELVDGSWTLFAFASWGGIPARLIGSGLNQMQRGDPVAFVPHPGHGIWIESVVPDVDGTWYAYYHHEVPGDVCGRADRQIPRLAAAKSVDRGSTWTDLGIILEAPRDRIACGSSNRFVLGGVGDVSALLDPAGQDLFLYFSQYSSDRSEQGVAVARLAWADRDAPRGRVTVWQNGAWLPARSDVEAEGDVEAEAFEYYAGTPLVPVSRPWHDADAAADAYWGPSIHWNTYLERYVMLLNRAKDESFNNEGIYVSYARTLDDPRAWSAPRKIMNGGGWYPQVAGLDERAGTDKHAGRRARFFLTGRSEHYIEFQR
jgi:hypothetical protein